MEEISEIEARIDDAKAVFHKPRNHGFVAMGETFVYIVREKPKTGFEFEEIHREDVTSLMVNECDEYETNTRLDSSEEAEKQEPETVDYAELQLTLGHKVVTVTVEECPIEVTRRMIELDAA